MLIPRLAVGETVTVSRRLRQVEGQPSTLDMGGGKSLVLEGDPSTTGVIQDKRLKDLPFELIGTYTSTGAFRIDPIHKRAMFVHKGGKRLIVTYWCAVCSIRTYTPGICYCCQDETELDLRETTD